MPLTVVWFFDRNQIQQPINSGRLKLSNRKMKVDGDPFMKATIAMVGVRPKGLNREKERTRDHLEKSLHVGVNNSMRANVFTQFDKPSLHYGIQDNERVNVFSQLQR